MLHNRASDEKSQVAALSLIGMHLSEMISDGYLIFILNSENTRNNIHLLTAALKNCNGRRSKILIPSLVKKLAVSVVVDLVCDALLHFDVKDTIEVIEKRLQKIGLQGKTRFDIIGAGSVHFSSEEETSYQNNFDGDYRIRSAGFFEKKEDAEQFVAETYSLYCSGPSAGGGARTSITAESSTASILIDRKITKFQTGYSDHSTLTEVPLIAASLGAKVIEKHFTLDKKMSGWDHSISADPKEMEKIVKSTKLCRSLLGSYKRSISKEEKQFLHVLKFLTFKLEQASHKTLPQYLQ